MALTDAYLIATKNLPAILDAIKSARAPDRFTLRFLEDLGFKATNDRLVMPLLKDLRFLDDNGAPTQRYFDFLDNNQSARILADGIKDAYEDLYRINKRAHTLSKADIVGKLKSLTEGKKSEKVIDNMARTFIALSKLADFSEERTPHVTTKPTKPSTDGEQPSGEVVEAIGSGTEETVTVQKPVARLIDTVTYRIEIVLPPVRDKAVYDAIFRSLKEHLL
jgi:hypothetical protein